MYTSYTKDYIESMKNSGANYVDWDELYRLHCEEKQQMINEEHRKAGRVIYDKASADRIRAEKAEATRLSIEKSRAARAARRAALIFSSQSDSESSSGDVLIVEDVMPTAAILVVSQEVMSGGDTLVVDDISQSSAVVVLDDERKGEGVENPSGDIVGDECSFIILKVQAYECENLIPVQDEVKVSVEELTDVCLKTCRDSGVVSVEVVSSFRCESIDARAPLGEWLEGYKGPLTVIVRGDDGPSNERGKMCEFCSSENGGCASLSMLNMVPLDNRDYTLIMEMRECCDGSSVCENCPRLVKMRRQNHCEGILGWTYFPVNMKEFIIIALSPWWFMPHDREKSPSKWGDYYKDFKIGGMEKWLKGYKGVRTALEVCKGFCPAYRDDCELDNLYHIFPPDVDNIRRIIDAKKCCDGGGCDNCPRVVEMFPFFHCTCFKDMLVFHLGGDHKHVVCFSLWWSDIIDPKGRFRVFANQKVKKKKTGKKKRKASKAKKKVEISVLLRGFSGRKSTGGSGDRARDGVG